MSAVAGILPRINRPGSRTGGKPRSAVRRNSVRVDRSSLFFRPLADSKAAASKQAERMMRAAEAWSEANRDRGVAPLTASTLKILETLLFKAMDWTTGQLDWSYGQIADGATRAIDTVWRALKQLEAGGWLERMRRCAPNPDTSLGAAPYIQITNAYRLQMPAEVASWMRGRRVKGWVPVPDDADQADRARRAEAAAARAQESREAAAAMLEAKRQQQESRRATWVQGSRPAKPAPPFTAPNETQAEMATRIRAAAEAAKPRPPADSD